MPILTIPEYKPDVSDYEGQATRSILNVVPRADGYGPWPDFNALTAALPAQCRGVFRAQNSDGSVTIFAATSTRLWKLNNTDLTWVPVSRALALTSISNASPAVFSLNSHGLSVGDAFVLSTSGTLPTGLTVGTVYYVISDGFGANSFQASTSPGGSAVNTSSAGSGTHSFTSYYTAIPSADQWQFAQFNNLVFATQLNAPLQVYNLTSSAAFADNSGSPPQARYIAVVNRFLVLSGLGSSTPYRIHWSAFNDTTGWTPGTDQSDFQDLPDGGIVRTVAGGEYGTITQDSALRRMVYNPGSTAVFSIERISEDKGILAPLSIVRSGDRMFYLGTDGFYMIVPGGYPVPIGKEKFSASVLAELDTSVLQYCIGASDPRATRVYWSYRTNGATTSGFNRILVYDYALERGSIVALDGEYLSTLAAPGITLENLDSVNSSIDAITASFDDISTVSQSRLAGVNTAHKLGFYSGSNIEATLVTASRGGDGRRIRIKGLRPVTDATSVFCSVSKRETQSATEDYAAETAVNSYGMCPQNVSTRYARGKMRIPAGTTWTFASGLEPEVVIEGKR